jgi:hypothetical protein
MPERFILVLAKEYGQSPGEIEQNWEPFWLNRALIELQAQGILNQRRENKLRSKARR